MFVLLMTRREIGDQGTPILGFLVEALPGGVR